LIFFFIDPSPFAPVSGAEDANDLASVGETYGQDASTYLPEAVVALFGLTVLQIFGYHAPGIGESILSHFEGNVVFFLILMVFAFIPLDSALCP